MTNLPYNYPAIWCLPYLEDYPDALISHPALHFDFFSLHNLTNQGISLSQLQAQILPASPTLFPSQLLLDQPNFQHLFIFPTYPHNLPIHPPVASTQQQPPSGLARARSIQPTSYDLVRQTARAPGLPLCASGSTASTLIPSKPVSPKEPNHTTFLTIATLDSGTYHHSGHGSKRGARSGFDQ